MNNTHMDGATLATIEQVRHILEEYVPFKLFPTSDRRGFEGAAKDMQKANGLLSVSARLMEDGRFLRASFGLVKGIGESVIKASTIIEYLSNLGERASLIMLDSDFYGLSLRIRMEPLTITRVTFLKSTIETTIKIADYLQEIAGYNQSKVRLEKQYCDFQSEVEPVFPFSIEGTEDSPGIVKKADSAIRLLGNGYCVAIACEQEILSELFLAIVASRLPKGSWNSLGTNMSFLPVQSVLELNRKIPGYLCIWSPSLGFALPNQRSGEIDLLLRLLEQAKKPVLFFGAYEEQMVVFGGNGQAAPANPLRPGIINLTMKDIDLNHVIRYFLVKNMAGGRHKIVTEEDDIEQKVIQFFQDNILQADEVDLLKPIIRIISSDTENPLEALDFLRSRKESFRGIPTKNMGKWTYMFSKN